MSSGLAVKLPLTVDSVFGPYNLITDFETLATQNLKMLVLTNPGERMMDINFGVGLRAYLFEQNVSDTFTQIRGAILEQVSRYLPYLKIERIEFLTPEGNPDLYPHQIILQLYYKIVPLKLSAVLEVEVNSGVN